MLGTGLGELAARYVTPVNDQVKTVKGLVVTANEREGVNAIELDMTFYPHAPWTVYGIIGSVKDVDAVKGYGLNEMESFACERDARMWLLDNSREYLAGNNEINGGPLYDSLMLAYESLRYYTITWKG